MLFKIKYINLINIIYIIVTLLYNTIILLTRVNRLDDNNDAYSLSTTYTITLSGDSNDDNIEVKEANDIEVAEVDKELYQKDDNADADIAIYNIFVDVALFEVAAEKATKTAFVNVEKVKLAMTCQQFLQCDACQMM